MATATSAADGECAAAVSVEVFGTLNGEQLLQEVLPGSAMVEELLGRLPPLLPGRRYSLARGEEVVESKALLSDLAASGSLRMGATVVPSPNAQEEMNLALIRAAGSLQLPRVRQLLEAGASAAFVHKFEGLMGSYDEKSALHTVLETARHGRSENGDSKPDEWLDVAKCLIQARADVNAKRNECDWRGCGGSTTAFEMVLPAAMNDSALLQLFLAAGANTHTKKVRGSHSMSTDGRSVEYLLHRAIKSSDVSVARVFLEAGAQVDALHSECFTNEGGFHEDLQETSLHIALGEIRDSDASLALAALLLAHGANVNAVRKDLKHVSVPRPLPSKSKSKSKKAPMYTDDPHGSDFIPTVKCVPKTETPLHLAIKSKDARLITLLLCCGADRSAVSKFGEESTSCEKLCREQGEESKKLLVLLQSDAAWGPEARALLPEAVLPDADAAVEKAKAASLCSLMLTQRWRRLLLLLEATEASAARDSHDVCRAAP